MPDRVDRLAAEYASLSTADRARLRMWAKGFCVGIRQLDSDDLTNEAMLRLADKRRDWPDDDDFMSQMRKVMRAVAREYREKENREPLAGSFEHRTGGRVGAAIREFEELPSEDEDSEQYLIRIQWRKQVLQVLEHRPIETTIVNRMFEGRFGKDAQGDLPRKTFLSAMRYIRRAFKVMGETWS